MLNESLKCSEDMTVKRLVEIMMSKDFNAIKRVMPLGKDLIVEIGRDEESAPSPSVVGARDAPDRNDRR